MGDLIDVRHKGVSASEARRPAVTRPLLPGNVTDSSAASAFTQHPARGTRLRRHQHTLPATPHHEDHLVATPELLTVICSLLIG
ncbi:hypothetical protein ETD86_27450 [Nonomuraea turkmeniaca]|uniref:Uncharacterized protein n=1 Tax=Nonomuraea turkmeniaca TaxID=103838 RepID=A0A5S4FBK5_9ACTN|nr:hypothetical protein [Nonomuraea turkmeniaca]TMR15286.1 hypothetical protein ETD86_27450 [Nonomuraea turkmeniaca]